MVSWLGSAEAQTTATATRSFPNGATVTAGGELTVEISATAYGAFGSVVETIPEGFGYVGTSLTGSQGGPGQELTFTLVGDASFTYTVTASEVTGSHSFSGTLTDFNRDVTDVGGETDVTVEAAAGPAHSATRAFSADTANTGAQLTVTIDATDYGASGTVTETLPAGFDYGSSSLAISDVASAGQEVTFSLGMETKQLQLYRDRFRHSGDVRFLRNRDERGRRGTGC